MPRKTRVSGMNINIICIGKLKEKYWQDAVKEYSKRLGSYCTLQIIELKESPLRANASAADELAVKEAEGKEILRRIICIRRGTTTGRNMLPIRSNTFMPPMTGRRIICFRSSDWNGTKRRTTSCF